MIRPDVQLMTALAVGLCGSCATAIAYDRAAAIEYARRWAVADEQNYNSAVYNYYGSNCGNFVAQCLIAGGIRFRASNSATDNVTPDNHLEMGTLPTIINTKAINDDDRKRYSRVISGADYLKTSITHTRHSSGRAQTWTDFGGTSGFWQVAQPGDILCLVDGGGNVDHVMIISEVDVSNHDLLYCGNTNSAKDKRASVADADWRTNGRWMAVTVADAPVVQAETCRAYVSSVHPQHSNFQPVMLRWGNSGSTVVSQGEFSVRRGQCLDIQVTFDTKMDTTSEYSQVFRLRCSNWTQLEFTAVSGGGWNENGWWTDADNPTEQRYQHRTWRGRICTSALEGRSVLATIEVLAASAVSGGWNDFDNELSRYWTVTVPGMNLLKVQLDTKETKGKRSGQQ